MQKLRELDGRLNDYERSALIALAAGDRIVLRSESHGARYYVEPRATELGDYVPFPAVPQAIKHLLELELVRQSAAELVLTETGEALCSFWQ